MEYPINGPPADNGNLLLGLGAATGSFDGFTFFATGYLCPVCLIATSAFLIAGVWRKWGRRFTPTRG